MSAVLVAAALDGTLREPPARAHPVVAMGSYLRLAARLVPAAPPGRALVAGGLAWVAGALAAAAAGVVVEAAAERLPRPARPLLRGAALWPLLSARMLLEEVRAVENALAVGLPAGRVAVSRIVSRDTADLDEAAVRASALESLAENLSDSVVAPLLAYAAGGLPAAAAYRFLNTADASWGYLTPRWRYAGRVAARADDLVNLVPARVTAALLLLGAPPAAWRRTIAEAPRTPSPNAGWPMAALAALLNLRLAKPGVYVLNDGGAAPEPADTTAALRLARRTVLLAVLLTAVADAHRRSPCPR